MPRRDRFSRQHPPPHHCAMCMRTCCHPSLFLLHSHPRSRPSLLSCPSSRVQRSSGTGWPPYRACVRSRAQTSASSQKSRRTSLKVSLSLSLQSPPQIPTPTRHPSRRTRTPCALGYASTCNSAPSFASPQIRLSKRRGCVSSPCTSLSRLARSRAWSLTCRATSTTIYSTTISVTAAWTMP